MELVNKIYLDNETMEYVAERYFIDGEEVTEEIYCETLDADIDDEYEDDECNCDICNFCGEKLCMCECSGMYEEDEYLEDEDDEEDGFYFDSEDDAGDFMDLVDEYVTLVQETQGCPDCIRELIVDLLLDFNDMFVEVEDEE